MPFTNQYFGDFVFYPVDQSYLTHVNSHPFTSKFWVCRYGLKVHHYYCYYLLRYYYYQYYLTKYFTTLLLLFPLSLPYPARLTELKANAVTAVSRQPGAWSIPVLEIVPDLASLALTLTSFSPASLSWLHKGLDFRDWISRTMALVPVLVRVARFPLPPSRFPSSSYFHFKKFAHSSDSPRTASRTIYGPKSELGFLHHAPQA